MQCVNALYSLFFFRALSHSSQPTPSTINAASSKHIAEAGLKMAYSQAHRQPLHTDSSSSSSTLSFPVDQAKLNPGFEAYKLVQDDFSRSLAKSYGLPSRPPRLTELYQSQHQSGNLTFTGLGYKETKERALHQVLIPASGEREKDEPFAAYVDSNGFVVVLTYDGVKDKVTGHPVERLERGGLPSLASISATEWLASSGTTVVLFRLKRVKLGDDGVVRWTSGKQTRWRMPSEASIKACKRSSGRTRVLLQSTKTTTSAMGKAKEGMQGLGFQSSTQQATEGSSQGQTGRSTTMFEVQLVELDNDDSGEDDGQTIRDAKLLWSVQGEEPLIMARMDEQETLLGAEASFTNMQRSSDRPRTATQPPEGGRSTSTAASATRGRRRAPHFSWAQTSDTITIAFALPSWITKSHIRTHFSLSALSLSFTQEALTLFDAPSSSAKITEIDNDAVAASGAEEEGDLTHAARMIASGRYVSRSTWAEIDPTGSLWTLERSRVLSLLTLHLEKKHEGTRWMQIFADRTGPRSRSRNRNYGEAESTTQVSFAQARTSFQAAAMGESNDRDQAADSDVEDDVVEDNEDDVPETMDPSELISMLEGMQKYTVDEESGGAGNGYGHDRTGLATSAGHGGNGGASLSLDQPSLLKDSLEEEDANVGRDFVVSSISSEGLSARSSEEGGKTTILATTLPGDNNENQTLVIKHDLDGAIFSPSSGSWNHASTMPALSFVLASKRDAQRVHVHQRRSSTEDYVVLAFESAPQVTGSGSKASSSSQASGAGNLFLYYSPSSSSAKHAASRVIRLGATDAAEEEDAEEDAADGPASGALLGVCSVGLPRGAGDQLEDTLVCLCENRMLLLRDIL